MNCKCGGKFSSKKDTFILSWELGIAIIAIVCNNCGKQRSLIMKATSWQDEEGIYDI